MNMMQRRPNKLVRHRRLAAGLMLGLLLSVLSMVHFQALHKALHPDANQPGHHCAVTLLSSGQIDSATCDVNVSFAPAVVFTCVTLETLLLPVSDISLLPSRAPPASLT